MSAARPVSDRFWNRMNPRLFLGAILCLGLALRLWGIHWGLPDRTDLHPDEHDYVLNYALKVSFAQPDPGFLNYPSFLMYLISLTFGGLRHIGAIAGEEWQAYLIGRLWSTFFATATILPIYKLARELGGSITSALLAALFAALLPLNIWEAHVAITDPLMTFWVAMTLLFSVRLIRLGRWMDYAVAGACLGFATGSKYTAALVTVAVVTGALTSRRPVLATFKGLLLAGTVALACAFVVMPFSFIRFPDLLKAMAYEHSHVNGHHYGFSLPADGWQYRPFLYQLTAAWPFSLGFALYGCAAAGTIWALLRFDRRKLPLLAFALVFVGVTASWSFVPLRYYLPVLLVGVLFAGLWLGALLETPSQRPVAIAALVVVLGYTSIFAVQTTARFTRETRQEAGHWLDANLKPGTTLLAAGWSRYLAMPSATNHITLLNKLQETPMNHLDQDVAFDLVEITSLHYARHLRQGNTGMNEHYAHLRDPAGAFERVARFDADFINKDLYMKLDPMFGGYFVSPTIEFYRPKQPHTLATSKTGKS